MPKRRLSVSEEETGEKKAWDLPKRPPRTAREKRQAHEKKAKQNSLVTAVRKSLTSQYHESFRSLRRELGRVGAMVMRFNDGDPVQIVLDRLDRVRGLRSRR